MTRPSFRRLSPRDHAKLLEVALYRLEGMKWREIAATMGWQSKQAAQRWSSRAMDRFWLGKQP